MFLIRIWCQNKKRDEIRVAERSFSIFIASRFCRRVLDLLPALLLRTIKKKGKHKKRQKYGKNYFIASESWVPNARRASVGGEFERRGASLGAEPEVTREGVGERSAAGRARGFVQTANQITKHDAVRPWALCEFGQTCNQSLWFRLIKA